MMGGKKTVARAVFYDAMADVEAKKKDPIDTFSKALQNITPRMELRSKRVGGANYQIPYEVAPERGVFLAMKWLIDASRKKKGMSMAKRLSSEVLDASSEAGEAFRRKQEIHKMADANKAFAHFGRRRK
jgi:small subunit ribosomal protein S7